MLQVDKLQQANVERAEEAEGQQPASMMSKAALSQTFENSDNS